MAVNYMYFNSHSSRQFTVFAHPQLSDQIIGKIYPREAFVSYGPVGSSYSGIPEDGTLIFFRNSSGQWTQGFLHLQDLPYLKGIDADYINYLKPITNNPYRTEVINVDLCCVFKVQNNPLPMRDRNGNPTGFSVPVGGLVAVKGYDAQMGQSYTTHKLIHWYKLKESDNYPPFNGWNIAWDGYAFVDTGIADGSMPSSIDMYGSW